MLAPLIRVGAVSAVVSGLTYVAYEALNLSLGYPETGPGDHLTSSLKALSLMLLVPAVVALYLHQCQRIGRAGLVGLLVAMAGTVLVAGIQLSDVWLGQPIEKAAPEIFETPSTSMIIGLFGSYAAYLVGWLVLAVATARAHVFSPWAGRAFVATAGLAVVGLIGVPGPAVPFSLLLAWLGWDILRQRGGSPERGQREALQTA